MQSSDPASTALLDVALCLGATRSLDALLPAVLERLVNLLGAERALFALFDDEGGVEDAVVHNLSWKPGQPLPISKSVVTEVLQSREMHLVVDTHLDRKLTGYDSIRKHRLRFILAVPVVACGRVAGVLWADSRAPVLADTVRRGETLKALAGIVGLAVENVLLLEEQRLRTMLVGKLVHDLKSPLLALLLNADVLRAMTASNGEVGAVTDGIVLAGRRMQLYCDNALSFSGIEAETVPQRPSRVVVPEMLDAYVRLFRAIATEYGLTMALHVHGALPGIETWVERVELALDNLVFNAIKHATTGTTVTLAARLRDDAGPESRQDRQRSTMALLFRKVPRGEPDPRKGFVELSVHNHGRPIAPTLLPRVFEEWVKGDDIPRGGASTGLGLAIVDQCARSLGGRAWVCSDDAKGTTFFFTVPVALIAHAESRAIGIDNAHDLA